jgi:hypothetical protein
VKFDLKLPESASLVAELREIFKDMKRPFLNQKERTKLKLVVGGCERP